MKKVVKLQNVAGCHEVGRVMGTAVVEDGRAIVPLTDELRWAFEQLKEYRSTDQNRFFMCEFGFDSKYLVATDGRRLMRVRITGLDKLLGKDSEGEDEVRAVANARIEGGNLIIEHGDPNWEYPNFMKVIPDAKVNNRLMVLDSGTTRGLLKELQKIGYLGSKRSNRIIVTARSGVVSIADCRVGECAPSEDFQVAINGFFLLDALMPSGKTWLCHCGEEMKAVSISSDSTDAVIMPMSLGEGQTPAEYLAEKTEHDAKETARLAEEIERVVSGVMPEADDEIRQLAREFLETRGLGVREKYIRALTALTYSHPIETLAKARLWKLTPVYAAQLKTTDVNAKQLAFRINKEYVEKYGGKKGEIVRCGGSMDNAYVATFARYLESKGYFEQKKVQEVQEVKAQEPVAKKEHKEKPKTTAMQRAKAKGEPSPWLSIVPTDEFTMLVKEWLEIQYKVSEEAVLEAAEMLDWRKMFFAKWLEGKKGATKRQALGSAKNEMFASLVDYLCEKGYLRVGKVA